MQIPVVKELAGEERIRALARPCRALSMLSEQSLDAIPSLPINDRIMNAFVDLPPVSQPPEINRVR